MKFGVHACVLSGLKVIFCTALGFEYGMAFRRASSLKATTESSICPVIDD